VGTSVNLAQVLLQQRRYAEAIPLLEAAVKAEPYNVTATYNLGVALTRAGRREEGAAVTRRFQELRESLYKTQFGQTYLEQGRYAEASASTGAEPELVEAGPPGLSFVVDEGALPAGLRGPGGGRPSLLDADGDGQLDLLLASAAGLRLLRNDRGRFTDVTAGVGLAGRPAEAGLGADLDNDGKTDLLLLRPLALLRNEGGVFKEPSAATGLPKDAPATVAALADLDHDGDLDLVLGGAGISGARLLRNNGDLTFADVTAESKLAAAGAATALVASDFDNRRDLDLLVARSEGPPLLFKNRRDGSFEDVAGALGLGPDGSAVAAGDVNKDSYTDLFLAGAKGARLVVSDGKGGFTSSPAPPGAEGAAAAMLADVDADGLLDLVVAGAEGLRTFRNTGRGFSDLGEAGGVPGAAAGLLAADLDQDGDLDLVVLGSDGAVKVARNEGGNRNRAVRVALTGRVSNRTGIGAKVELRAGSLRQKLETYASTPAAAPDEVFFGLGRRQAADVVRIIWTSGIVQTETEFPARAAADQRLAALEVTELDRKPSSCPYLFAWNGRRFEFVTDFLGAGEMGYWLAPGVRSTPDPDEYVRLTAEQLVAKDGRYELRVTNELEETLFLDHLRLLAVDHPDGVEVHPAEGMTRLPREFRLFAARDLRTPRATDERGRDWTEAVSRVDRRFAGGLPLRPLRGYAEPHSLTLDLGPLPATHTLLLLTAWTDYAFSSDNVAAAQRGWSLEPPVLEVEGEGGRWTKALEVGVPVGRPQTIVLDLGGLRLGLPRRIRLATSMRVYFDRIAVGARAHISLEPRRLDPLRADLRERGFSAEVSPDGEEPFAYDYARVSWPSPWKLMPGRYTRPGDVLELLAGSDDLFVVSRPGDELALSFDARSLGALAPGRTRTFLLYADGFSKEMDINSSSPDVAGPLPFHGMKSYPYPPEEAPERLKRNAPVQSRYDTRVVSRTYWPLELARSHHRDTKLAEEERRGLPSCLCGE
jgi:hypothetical protein